MPIDLTAPPTVEVTGVIRAPLAQVWAAFRPFGPEIMQWWPIYEWVRLEDPGQDVVGCVRTFLTKSGRTYRERLVERNDEAYTERYDMLSVEPSVPTFEGAVTRVQMSDGGQGTTLVVWRSWSKANAILLGQIRSTQTEVYQGALASLDRHFNPSLGTLEVRVGRAQGLKNGSLLPTEAYVVVDLDGGVPVRTRVRHLTESPVFGESFSLEVLSNQGRLRMSAWDAHLGRDLPLGASEVEIHGLPSGEKKSVTVNLHGSAGPSNGTVALELTLRLKQGDSLPETDVEQRLEHLAVLQTMLEKLTKQALQIAQQVAQGPQPKWGYARYDRTKALPDVPLEDLPRMVAGLPPEAALSPEKIGRLVQRGVEYLYSQASFLKRAEADTQDPYLAYFGGWVEPPKHIVDHWRDDAELARQFIQGVGPMVLTRVTDIAVVPAGMRSLQPGGQSLEALAANRRLYLLDYAALADLKPYRDMVFYAPYVLVYVEQPPGARPRLNLAAIQLTRSAGPNPVYTPDSTPKNRWAFAKMHVACADNQYHQWLFHLGYAHLAMEPFVVAWHDALPSDHVVSRLLAPHFRDTIGINFLARQTLVSEIAPFTDRTFSTGTAQALQMFLGAWKSFDFFEQSFPKELARRGFDEARSDGLEGYFYRDDGFLVWNALGDYVRDVVTSAYPDDGAVAADTALAAWAAESTHPDKADIPGFPKSFPTRALLVDTLQALIWAVSAQHSAVNFSQYHFLSYVPNRPDSLFAAMPEGMDEIDPKVIADALPGPKVSHFQISFAWLLGLPSDHPLTAVDAMAEIHPEAHHRFQAALKDISAKIRARNEALVAEGLDPYPYLLPENVASSIAI